MAAGMRSDAGRRPVAGQHVASSFVFVPSLHSSWDTPFPALPCFVLACCPHAGVPALVGSSPSLQLLQSCHSAPAVTMCSARLMMSMHCCNVERARVDLQIQDSALQMRQHLQQTGRLPRF